MSVLEVSNVTKAFAGTMALSGVSMDVEAGEIHGLLGENGAGKSTLIKIIAGVHAQDAGEIRVNGTDLAAGHTPEHARAAGVAFIHQDFGLVGTMSVAENIALVDGFPTRARVIDWGSVRAVSHRILEPLGVDLPPNTMIDELPIGQRAVVAIARAVAARARLLILDEPTASLGAAEARTLFGVMRALRASGVALVFVSHRMDEVAEFCDRATILRNGKNVGTVRMAETSRRDMVELIVGRAVAVGTRRVAGADPPGSVRLEADGLTAGLLREFSLAVRAGEIVGVTGLAGSGASDLGDAVIGRVGVERGRLLVGGAPFSPRGVRRALRAGIALVPADRAAEGLFLSLSLRENLNPNPRPAESAGAERSRRPSALARRVIRRRGEEAATRDVLQRFDIRPPEPERVASTLSGGNAQKLMLGRWLDENPRIVILNEPTTGIDVGARQQIYEYLRRAAAAGAAVIVISSDFHEIAELCDRAVVLYRGYTAAVLEGGSLNTAAVTTAALGEDQ